MTWAVWSILQRPSSQESLISLSLLRRFVLNWSHLPLEASFPTVQNWAFWSSWGDLFPPSLPFFENYLVEWGGGEIIQQGLQMLNHSFIHLKIIICGMVYGTSISAESWSRKRIRKYADMKEVISRKERSIWRQLHVWKWPLALKCTLEVGSKW